MRVAAIIAEYNPFHFGHKYQLELVKQRAGAAVVIMSGPFVQRGEAAVTDKWTRARDALNNGADLVIELPVIYALNSAREFASGAVELLDKTGVIDELCFGAETENAALLENAAELAEHEPPDVSAKIKSLMAMGAAYPAAREKAFSGLIDEKILSQPNNILAVEYIRALKRIKSNIKPVPIRREGSGYHDIKIDRFASASGIRARLFGGEDISELLPEPRFDVYDTKMLDTAVTARLRTITPAELSNINEVSEGLENRIIRAALEYSSITDIAEAVKTKRYTMSRIKRILLSSLIGITKELAKSRAGYVRVLGMTAAGAELLKKIKANGEVITKTADYKGHSPVFEADIRAQNLFSLCGKNKRGNTDFTVSPVIVR